MSTIKGRCFNCEKHDIEVTVPGRIQLPCSDRSVAVISSMPPGKFWMLEVSEICECVCDCGKLKHDHVYETYWSPVFGRNRRHVIAEAGAEIRHYNGDIKFGRLRPGVDPEWLNASVEEIWGLSSIDFILSDAELLTPTVDEYQTYLASPGLCYAIHYEFPARDVVESSP